MTTRSRRLHTLVVLVATIALGLAWRSLPLPYFAWKYGGSMLWASAVYWLIATIAPRARTTTLATISALVSIAVEFSRRIDYPPLNHFRHTLPGRLFLGAIFSPRNIAAYLLAILLTALADHTLRRKS